MALVGEGGIEWSGEREGEGEGRMDPVRRRLNILNRDLELEIYRWTFVVLDFGSNVESVRRSAFLPGYSLSTTRLTERRDFSINARYNRITGPVTSDRAGIGDELKTALIDV